MKKIIAIVLAIVMMAAISVPAFAAEQVSTFEKGETGSMTVSYGIDESYTIGIPADIDFRTQDTFTNQEVTASDVIIAAGKTLTVSVTSTYTWKMNPDVASNTAVPYKVTYKLNDDQEATLTTIDGAAQETPSATAVVLTAQPAEGLEDPVDVTTTMTFTCDGTSQAGSFSDTLTFTVAVE